MDKEAALDFLSNVAEGIAKMFGSSCETLVHDMSVPNHPIVAIYNGHVTGREVGSITDVYGNEGSNDNTDMVADNFVNHLVVRPSGQQLKSTTFHLSGEGYHYALGINFDYTAIVEANRFFQDFSRVGTDLQLAISQAGEAQVDDIFAECVDAIGKPVEEMSKKDRQHLVGLLRDKQIFSLQRSVPYVAEKLNVSRYTIYKYLNESTKKANGDI